MGEHAAGGLLSCSGGGSVWSEPSKGEGPRVCRRLPHEQESCLPVFMAKPGSRAAGGQKRKRLCTQVGGTATLGPADHGAGGKDGVWQWPRFWYLQQLPEAPLPSPLPHLLGWGDMPR